MENSFQKEKPKVLILTCARDVSGPVKGVFQFLNSLENEIDYYLFNIRSDDTCCTILEEGAERAGLTLGSFNQQSRFSPAILGEVRRFVIKQRINIIQTHGYKPSVVGLYVKMTTSTRWVCFFHGLTTENLKVRLYHWLDRLIQLCADKLVIVSDNMRQQVISRHGKERIVVIRNAINSSNPSSKKYGGEVIRNELGISEDEALLVVIGRLSPEKGVDVFLETMAHLQDEMENVYAAIIGEGQEQKKLKELCRNHKLLKRVFFCGFQENVGDFLEAADIVVIPSRSEGIPNVLLEAMAFGKPVVATAVGGIPEVLSDRKEGLLVPPEDSKRLAEALKFLLKNKDIMAAYGKSGEATVKQYFTPVARKRQILSVYNDVLLLK